MGYSLSIGFPSQEYWSGSPFPSPGDLPNPGIEPGSTALRADSLLTFLFKVIIDMYVLMAILLIVLNLSS